MIDLDTFLTTLYTMADDFCQSELPKQKQAPGPMASLQCSEVITLALFGQWVQFPSERAFYRYAEHHLRAAFPDLPNRAQLICAVVPGLILLLFRNLPTLLIYR